MSKQNENVGVLTGYIASRASEKEKEATTEEVVLDPKKDSKKEEEKNKAPEQGGQGDGDEESLNPFMWLLKLLKEIVKAVVNVVLKPLGLGIGGGGGAAKEDPDEKKLEQEFTERSLENSQENLKSQNVDIGSLVKEVIQAYNSQNQRGSQKKNPKENQLENDSDDLPNQGDKQGSESSKEEESDPKELLGLTVAAFAKEGKLDMLKDILKDAKEAFPENEEMNNLIDGMSSQIEEFEKGQEKNQKKGLDEIEGVSDIIDNLVEDIKPGQSDVREGSSQTPTVSKTQQQASI